MGAHVLLIDDEEEFSNRVKNSFLLSNIPLDHAASWDEGVAMFRVGLHELVIADYHLPQSDLPDSSLHGLKLLARIKPLRPSSELILISGAVTSVPEERIRRCGLVNTFLPKTLNLVQTLIPKAQQAMDRAKRPCNWVTVAQAHRAGADIDESEIEEIDLLMRQNLSEG